MTGSCGRVQRLFQERENRNSLCSPFASLIATCSGAHIVDCTSQHDFLHVYGNLDNIFRKPRAALHYNGKKLKRLLEQRWSGHLATVAFVLNAFQHLTSLLQEMDATKTCRTETHM